METSSIKSHEQTVDIGIVESRNEITESEKRLNELGYKSEFRRDMSLFGVLGISFCAIGILTGMSSAFQTGLFSGGPLGLFWGWNVSPCVLMMSSYSPVCRSAVCSCFLLRFHWQKYAAHSE
jgi:hypothetical protein